MAKAEVCLPYTPVSACRYLNLRGWGVWGRGQQKNLGPQEPGPF